VKRTISLFFLVITACGPQRPPLPPDACRPSAEGEHPWEGRGYTIDLPWNAPRRGAAQPRVVIQEFSDFECPYCSRAQPQIDQAIDDYGACVAVIWRNYPLPYHPHAELAARAATEVYTQRGDQAFWRYHDSLFADQLHLTRADLEQRAQQIEGIDMNAFRQALDQNAHSDVIARDRAAIEGTGARVGTPTFFVSGTLINGAQPYENFQIAIETALREAYR
jgi:protein-disulfide isomerase